jgi:hypothetical protein
MIRDSRSDCEDTGCHMQAETSYPVYMDRQMFKCWTNKSGRNAFLGNLQTELSKMFLLILSGDTKELK